MSIDSEIRRAVLDHAVRTSGVVEHYQNNVAWFPSLATVDSFVAAVGDLWLPMIRNRYAEIMALHDLLNSLAPWEPVTVGADWTEADSRVFLDAWAELGAAAFGPILIDPAPVEFSGMYAPKSAVAVEPKLYSMRAHSKTTNIASLVTRLRELGVEVGGYDHTTGWFERCKITDFHSALWKEFLVVEEPPAVAETRVERRDGDRSQCWGKFDRRDRPAVGPEFWQTWNAVGRELGSHATASQVAAEVERRRRTETVTAATGSGMYAEPSLSAADVAAGIITGHDDSDGCVLDPCRPEVSVARMLDVIDTRSGAADRRVSRQACPVQRRGVVGERRDPLRDPFGHCALKRRPNAESEFSLLTDIAYRSGSPWVAPSIYTNAERRHPGGAHAARRRTDRRRPSWCDVLGYGGPQRRGSWKGCQNRRRNGPDRRKSK